MIATIVILSIVSLLLLISFVISVRLNIRLGKILLDLEEQIETSLDALDTRYTNLDRIAKHPVLIDEPFVRSAVSSIKEARDEIHVVAQKLSTFGTKEDVKR